MEPKWEILRVILANMNQTVPNSQETVLKITLTEALVLNTKASVNVIFKTVSWIQDSGFRIDKAAKATLCSKAEAIYPLSAPGSEGESCYVVQTGC